MTTALHRNLFARALGVFRELEEGLQHLDHARLRASILMEEMVARYDKLHFPSRLGLTVTHTLSGGGPARIAWGVLFSPTHLRGRLRADVKDGVIWIRKLPGDLNQDIIQKYCRDASKAPVLLALERRRVFLNRAIQHTLSPLRSIMSTVRLLTRPSLELPPDPPFPTGCRTRTLPTIAARTLQDTWSLGVRLAGFEHELIALAETHNATPPDPRFKLHVAQDPFRGTQRSFWKYIFLDDRYLTLTVTVMRELRVPKSARREITSYEFRRRKLTKLCDRYAKVVLSLRKRADDAADVAVLLLGKAEESPLPDAA